MMTAKRIGTVHPLARVTSDEQTLLTHVRSREREDGISAIVVAHGRFFAPGGRPRVGERVKSRESERAG